MNFTVLLLIHNSFETSKMSSYKICQTEVDGHHELRDSDTSFWPEDGDSGGLCVKRVWEKSFWVPEVKRYYHKDFCLIFSSGGILEENPGTGTGHQTWTVSNWRCQEATVTPVMVMPHKVFDCVDVRPQVCYFSIFLQVEFRVGKLMRYLVAPIHRQ